MSFVYGMINGAGRQQLTTAMEVELFTRSRLVYVRFAQYFDCGINHSQE
jgi:hypothetical protein